VGAAAEDRLRPFFIETMLVEPVDDLAGSEHDFARAASGKEDRPLTIQPRSVSNYEIDFAEESWWNQTP
jgi:hypothetical protein